MAEWLPRFVVTDGLYRGQTPDGNLDSYMSECALRVFGTVLAGGASYTRTEGTADPDHEWEGSFGQNENAMRDYGNLHADQGVINTDILVFEVPNPPNVQYYKQELVVYGGVRCIKEIGHNDLGDWEIRAYDMGITRIYRREYATPYSVPTVTHEFFGGGASYGFTNCRWVWAGYPTIYEKGTLMEKFRFATSYYTHENVKYLCFCAYWRAKNPNTTYYLYSTVGISVPALTAAFGVFQLDENDDPNIDPDPGDDDPGVNPPPEPGPREKEYDPVPIPPDPGLTAIGSGFITLYSPSSTTLNLLADEIFADNIIQVVANYFSSISDLIAGLSIVPFFVPVSGFAHHKIGLFTSNVMLPLVSSQFITIDCGSVAVNRYFNNFLDQSPNTKTLIYLPYIGYQELNTDEVIGNTISVKYKCDILSGACVAFVSIGSGGEGADVTRVIAQFSGNVITQVPTAAQAYDSMVSNAINILTSSVGIAAGAAIGGGIGAGTGTMAQATAGASQISSAVGAQVGIGMAGTAANTIMAMKPTFARNGTPGSTAGYMSVQTPYLIKIVPRDAVASNHIQLKGYPSNYGGTMAGLSGYCEVSEIHLQGVNASVDEITEIYSLLKGGVIV